MKKYLFNSGIIGGFLLLLGAFLPIATLNSKWITIVPNSGNFTIGEDFWMWRNISAFAVTYVIAALLIFYFSIREKHIGIIICGFVDLLVTFFIFVALMMTALELESIVDIQFSIGFAWLFVAGGIILVFVSGAQIKKQLSLSK